MLLRSLVELGYLKQDESGNSSLPTPRVTLLGSWIEPLPLHGGRAKSCA